MKTITIDTNKGPAQVPAYLHGKFAVHLPYFPQQNFDDRDPEHIFHITHIATGLKVTSIYGRPAARKVAAALDAALDADITPADHANKTPAWRAFGAAVKATLKERGHTHDR